MPVEAKVQKTEKKSIERTAYEKPTLKVVHEKELLELLGPAQGYGHLRHDNEWFGG